MLKGSKAAIVTKVQPVSIHGQISLDVSFVDPAPPGMQKFWILHAAYTSLEMVKLLVGFVAAWWIVKSG